MGGGGAVLLTSPILWHCACFKMMIFFLSCRMHENAFSHLGFFLFVFLYLRGFWEEGETCCGKLLKTGAVQCMLLLSRQHRMRIG